MLVALAILVADLVTKQIMLGLVFDPPRRIEVTPFLNFVPVWNPGISFGILADAGGAVPALLTALAIAVAAWLFLEGPAVQAPRAPRRGFHRWWRGGERPGPHPVWQGG